VSGDGAEELDRTPEQGKFWVYEQGVRAPYYVLYYVGPGRVDVHRLVDGRYEKLEANERGHYPIASLGVELGIWQGVYQNQELPWLRWWDTQGKLLPTSEERAEQERQRAERERKRAERERKRAERESKRAERLAEQLRALGVEPEE